MTNCPRLLTERYKVSYYLVYYLTDSSSFRLSGFCHQIWWWNKAEVLGSELIFSVLSNFRFLADFRLLFSNTNLSAPLIQNFVSTNQFATKKYSKKTKTDVIRLFTNMKERKFEWVVKRNPTPDHRTPKYAERMSHELIHGLTHHKALKGSVLVVKQMQLILAFGFDRRRLKVFFLFKYAISIRVNVNRTYYKSAGEFFYPCWKYLPLVRFAHLWSRYNQHSNIKFESMRSLEISSLNRIYSYLW